MQSDTVDGMGLADWLDFLDFVRCNSEMIRREGILAPELLRSVDAPRFERMLHLQGRLQPKIARKFFAPERWIWSSRYLELATNQSTAEMTASFFPAESKVIDIGCGGGSDAVALAKRGNVLCVDTNRLAVDLVATNWTLQAESHDEDHFQVRLADAAHLDVASTDFIHLDPDRRQQDRRSVSLQWHSPNLTELVRLIQNSAGGSIKLAPACRDEFPVRGTKLTRQFVTFDRSVVQQRWWWGCDSVPETDLWISSHSMSNGWCHVGLNRSLAADESRIVRDAKDLKPGMFIGDGDPSLRAAACQLDYAEESEAKLLGSREGFYVADRPDQLIQLVRWYEIVDVLPYRVKALRSFLASTASDAITLKTRGVLEVPPDLQRLAEKSGSKRTLVFATRDSRRHLLVVAT